MGVIEVKDNVIAEEKVEVLSTPSIRMRLFAKLLGQDVKSVQSAMHWKMNQDTPGTETIFKPFGVLTPQDFRNVYDRCGLVRYACEKMSRDIFQNGLFIPSGKTSSRNKNLLLEKKWMDLPTPQNPDWGMRDLLVRWVTLERKEGWAGLGRTKSGAYFVFSEQEYQDKVANYKKKGDKVKSLRPHKFECKFVMKHGEFDYTFEEKDVVILVTRPKEKDWRGFPLIEPVYAEVVYITNIEYGMAQAYWRFGVGNYVLYHPKGTNLTKAKAEFGSIGHRKTLHLTPLDHPNAAPLGRVQNVGVTSVQGMESELRLYYNIVLAYLEIPETWYFGSGQGTLSTTYMNSIAYESTIQNEKEDIYSAVLKALSLIMKNDNIPQFEWNTGQIMDDMSKAEMLTGIDFLTPNEKRKLWDDKLGDVNGGDDIVDLQTREFDIESKPTDTTQKPKIDD